MDTNPLAAGHVLIVPELHHPSLSSVPAITGCRVFVVAQADWSAHPARAELDRVAGLIRAALPDPFTTER